MTIEHPTSVDAHDGRPAAGRDEWGDVWRRHLPVLALIGPACWFIAALVRAAGLGVLDGDLDWISRPEGLVMFLGSPFFVATFIALGRVVADRSVRVGVTVTALGLIGVAPLAAIAALRLFMGQFVDAGLDPDQLNEAFETGSGWDAGFLFFNIGQFVAWIIAGVSIIRKGIAPKWAGASLILGVVAIVSAQGAYIALEVLWPLGTGLWLLGTWRVLASTTD